MVKERTTQENWSIPNSSLDVEDDLTGSNTLFITVCMFVCDYNLKYNKFTNSNESAAIIHSIITEYPFKFSLIIPNLYIKASGFEHSH